MRLPKYSVSVVQSRTIVFLLAAIFILGLSVVLGQIWEKKDYKEWAAKDCEKILTNSPWAKNQQMLGSGLGGSGEGGNAYTLYTVQFYSALPIRQAVIRQQMIANKYEKLPPDRQQEFDKQAQPLLKADYSDKVVVKINYETNVSTAMLDLVRGWTTQTIGNFQNTTFLIGSKGAKVAPIDYRAVGDQYVLLTFPRATSDGKPLVTTEDKNIILQFPYKPVQGMGNGNGQFEFKVKDMIFGGQIAY